MGAGASVDEGITVEGELAKVLSASDNDLAKAADKLNRDIKRMVPKTASGRLDAASIKEDERESVLEGLGRLNRDIKRMVPKTASGRLDAASIKEDERESVHEVLGRARRLAEHGYAVSWGYYRKTVDGGPAARDADELLVETRRLAEDFPDEPPPPRCDLPEGASIKDLAFLAYFKGDRLLEPLEAIVQEAGGEYKRGPRKKEGRIREKMEEYGGDFARVVDLERATGVFDSVDDLSLAISLLRAASRRGDITIRRCKDRFGKPFENGYRDLQLNVELDGFVGELQLNLRRISEVKAKAHTVYEVERVLKAGEGRGALQSAVDGPGLESEQVLRLRIEGGRSIEVGSLAAFEAALARALPPGCVVANVYSGEEGDVRVRLGLDEVAAMAKLRDDVVLESRAFEDALNESLPDGTKISVDRAAFLECYSRIMMRFGKLTPHQREKLKELRAANVAVLLSPAGGGKTFLAIQRLLEELRGDAGAVVLFVARNVALALFVCKWLVAASRKSAKHVVDRMHVLVAPFEDGPRRVRVDGRRLVLDAFGGEVVKYALVVVDEAHHLVSDAALRAQLADIGAAQTRLLLLADASQATATHKPDQIARSLVDLPQEQKVAVATLSEVVRSTKRIVAGAAAFQLEAGRKAETKTHAASVGPPLVARIFNLADGEDTSQLYAREVVEALSAVQEQLADLSDLDDRVAVVGPDEAFVENLRGPLELALGGFELVDAATASAALPRDEERSFGSKPWLVVDSVENMDGLERLVVICVGLDQVIDRGAGVLETRSRLYRAMTRAQLAVAVVNEVLPGGWLEFLGRVELVAGGGYNDAAERGNREETAADDVVGAVVEKTSAPVRDSVDSDKGAVEKASLEDTGAPAEAPMPADKDGKVEEGVAEELVRAVEEEAAAVPSPEKKGAAEGVDASATTPSEAEPMKVLQSIWDASAVATASRGDLRFMPFSEGVDLSKLVELRTLERHSHGVKCVAVFPDGRRVVSCAGAEVRIRRTDSSSDDEYIDKGEIKVWDVATGKCVATLEGHSDWVQGVAVFPDGRRVVSGSRDNTLKVWDVETGECVATLEGHSGKYGVNCVAVFPDGRRVVSASGDKTLKLWDVATGKCVATLEGHSGSVSSVAVFPDGRRVVSGSQDKTLKVWDVATGRCLATLKGHSERVYSVAVFPDGRRVVSGSYKTLKVWDVTTGRCVATLEGHSGSVLSVAVFPDGRRVVSASRDTTLKVWDIATGECLATLEGHSEDSSDDAVLSVAVFPDGLRVVSGGNYGELKLWGLPES